MIEDKNVVLARIVAMLRPEAIGIIPTIYMMMIHFHAMPYLFRFDKVCGSHPSSVTWHRGRSKMPKEEFMVVARAMTGPAKMKT